MNAPSQGSDSSSQVLPFGLTKNTTVVGSATFTYFATLLTIGLVGLLASNPNSVANAEVIQAPVTLHILDTSTGVPAANIYCELERNTTDGWALIGSSTTGSDGRSNDIVPTSIDELDIGTYRVIFHTKAYFEQKQVATFYPRVDVLFLISNSSLSYHIPLILNPWGYSTYRGS